MIAITPGPVVGDVNLSETGVPLTDTPEEAAEIAEDIQQTIETLGHRSGSHEAF
jgi:hypothetical protein